MGSDTREGQDMERARAAGFDGHLSKPIDPGSFADTVARFLPLDTERSSHVPAE